MKCGKCSKSSLKRATIRHEIEVAGERFVGTIEGHQCGSCGDAQLPLDALVKLEHAVAHRLAEKGPVNGSTMRYMRKSIPISAANLAQLLRVAPETVSRWETGERAVDRAAWLVVRELLLNPGEQSRIAELRDEPSKNPVPIAV